MRDIVLYFWMVVLVEMYVIDTLQTIAQKGQLFIYTLHSASFFPAAVDVKWSVTLRNRPALPSWLHLVPSRHKALAYLVGTPVTGTKQITAHVLAKRLDTFECEQRYLVITLSGDERYDRATQQVIDIHVENIEAEYLLSDRNDLRGKLVNSVKEAFRGKDVYPYVYCIQPGLQVPAGKEHLFGLQKTG